MVSAMVAAMEAAMAAAAERVVATRAPVARVVVRHNLSRECSQDTKGCVLMFSTEVYVFRPRLV